MALYRYTRKKVMSRIDLPILQHHLLCQLLDFYKPKTIPSPAPARIIHRGLKSLNLNKTKLKPAKRAIGIGLIRERRFPV